MHKKLNTKTKTIIHVILIIGAVAMILPFVWMILTSGKTVAESTMIPPQILPDSFRWENYSTVWDALPFISFFINTGLMIFFRILTSTLFSAMATFAVAKLEFPGKNVFFMIVLTQMMIPPQIFLTPQYLLVQNLGLLNTVPALVIPGLVSAFGTFLLRQFFMKLPDELMEAATIDGANIWQIFYRIYLPLAKSGLVSLAIFTALFAYKDLMWPLIVNMSQNKMTLSAGLASLQGQYATNYPELMAGSVLAIIPMVILYVIFQKRFIQGIATTGGK
ncbi:multiple sugar transport system permease protein [Alkalibacterium subtropicum]|uniref:Multiple sugar transport system permease protein n=1 Tax=Alkalibacterium subtropicum TaxID=753702 RepID=A0A1I1GCW2_9LACT|nr:carbohydrate ABC transporter permease [Alkalibacterium subtropicum]SFC09306.1 multiple sugar transport system permease protein [Alkalibacterium subtropicum]